MTRAKTNKTRKAFAIATITMLSLTTNAQSPMADGYLKSPSMAALGEYGEVPVSLYTGIASVNVPLFTLESGNHSIDLSLSYHGGGVRPDSHPGWVGMDWTLHAGGSITRVVGGMPDESDNYRAVINEFGGSYYAPKMGMFYEKKGQFSNTSDRMDIPTQNLSFPTFTNTTQSLAYPVWDIEPDRFMFNFMGYTGSFFYTFDKGWVVECDKPVKVLFDIKDTDNYSRVFNDLQCGAATLNANVRNCRSVAINNFLIVDEYGNKYYFGGKDKQEAIEYSVGFFNQHNSEITASAWHLTKIEYADGRSAEFTYEKKNYVSICKDCIIIRGNQESRHAGAKDAPSQIWWKPPIITLFPR